MTYTVTEMAKILNLTKTNVAYRLGKLNLKEPHDDSHLSAVRDYLVNQSKPVTIWQLVVQRYGQDNAKNKYQPIQYRWCKLGKPVVTSLEELDELWNKHCTAKKERTEANKKHVKEEQLGTSLFNKKTGKIRHLYIWKTFDPNGVWDSEVKEWYFWYRNDGYRPQMSRRLAYIEVLKQHHLLDQDEYFDFKESDIKLKMILQKY